MTAVATGTAGGAEIADRIRAAIAARTPVRIAGAGTWLDAGHPVRHTGTIDVAAHRGIVEYVPGDLTLTARAGTPLDEIADATAAHGQWLPLDPAGSPRGTLGATVATASAGPLAHAFGGPRDLALGIECVTGRGEVVRGGGRVTKNVAGFDLTRLLTGAWGTLGVITEVTVRLRARPPVDLTVSVDVPAAADSLARRLARLRAAPLEPLAAEMLNPALAAALGLGDGPRLLVRLGGNAGAVRAQRGAVAAIGECAEVDRRVWEMLRAVEPAGSWTWRMSRVPSRTADTWRDAAAITAAAPEALLHASPGRGIVRCIVPPGATGRDDALARSLAGSPFDGTIIVERAPADRLVRASRYAPGADVVARRIRDAFDPHRVLNPGILGEEEP